MPRDNDLKHENANQHAVAEPATQNAHRESVQQSNAVENTNKQAEAVQQTLTHGQSKTNNQDHKSDTAWDNANAAWNTNQEKFAKGFDNEWGEMKQSNQQELKNAYKQVNEVVSAAKQIVQEEREGLMARHAAESANLKTVQEQEMNKMPEGQGQKMLAQQHEAENTKQLQTQQAELSANLEQITKLQEEIKSAQFDVRQARREAETNNGSFSGNTFDKLQQHQEAAEKQMQEYLGRKNEQEAKHENTANESYGRQNTHSGDQQEISIKKMEESRQQNAREIDKSHEKTEGVRELHEEEKDVEQNHIIEKNIEQNREETAVQVDKSHEKIEKTEELHTQTKEMEEKHFAGKDIEQTRAEQAVLKEYSNEEIERIEKQQGQKEDTSQQEQRTIEKNIGKAREENEQQASHNQDQTVKEEETIEQLEKGERMQQLNQERDAIEKKWDAYKINAENELRQPWPESVQEKQEAIASLYRQAIQMVEEHKQQMVRETAEKIVKIQQEAGEIRTRTDLEIKNQPDEEEKKLLRHWQYNELNNNQIKEEAEVFFINTIIKKLQESTDIALQAVVKVRESAGNNSDSVKAVIECLESTKKLTGEQYAELHNPKELFKHEQGYRNEMDKLSAYLALYDQYFREFGHLQEINKENQNGLVTEKVKTFEAWVKKQAEQYIDPADLRHINFLTPFVAAKGTGDIVSFMSKIVKIADSPPGLEPIVVQQSILLNTLSVAFRVNNGARLYRLGASRSISPEFPSKSGNEAQYWSLEDPRKNIERYLINHNMQKDTKYDYVEIAILKKGANFIVRQVSPFYKTGNKNAGSALEVVIEPSGTKKNKKIPYKNNV